LHKSKSFPTKDAICRCCKRDKIPAVRFTRALILVFLGLLTCLEGSFGCLVAVGRGIQVRYGDINDTVPGPIKETANEDVSAFLRMSCVLRSLSWVDEGFQADLGRSKGSSSNRGKLIPELVVADYNQATFIASEGMFDGKGCSAAITSFGQVGWHHTITKVKSITKFK